MQIQDVIEEDGLMTSKKSPNKMYVRECEIAQTVILTPKQADELHTPTTAPDSQPRRNSTSRSNSSVRALNLANVDNYVGKISLIQAGANSTRSRSRRNLMTKEESRSFKITPANITDELIQCKDDTEILRMNSKNEEN